MEDLKYEAHNPTVFISAVKDSFKYSFLGSEDGILYVVKNEFLQIPVDKFPKDLPFNSFVQARQYPAHISFVDKIEMSSQNDLLFTTGLNDECIF